MSCRKLIIGAAIAATGLAGGSVAATDYPPAASADASSYPPAAPPESTVASSSQHAVVVDPETPETPQAIQRPAALPETGSDTSAILKVAGGAVVAGAGLLTVATRRRRHPATN